MYSSFPRAWLAAKQAGLELDEVMSPPSPMLIGVRCELGYRLASNASIRARIPCCARNALPVVLIGLGRRILSDARVRTR